MTLRIPWLARRRVAMLVVAAVVGALLWAGGASQDNTYHASAHFPKVIGLYEGDDVTVLGYRVGKITAIVPGAEGVRVDFTYDVPVPSDVKAVITSPSLVPVRTLALTPAYAGGESLAEGASIPESRTAVPLEWDDVKTQLTELSTALGPTGANKDGALGRAITTTSRNLAGNGEAIRSSVSALADAMETLGENKGEVFGTVRNLQVFVKALKASDDQVAAFNNQLASTSNDLEGMTRDVGPALESAREAMTALKPFLRRHRGKLLRAVDDLRPLLAMLAESRYSVAGLLHSAPTAVSNMYGLYDPYSASINAAIGGDNVRNPSALICSLFASYGAQGCAQLLAPLVSLATLPDLPAGVSLVERNGRDNVAEPPRPHEDLAGLMVPEPVR